MARSPPPAAPRPDELAQDPSVLVLMGNPARSDLTERVALSVATAFRHRLGRLRWLAPGIACEYPITDGQEEAGGIAGAVREGLGPLAIDVAVVRAAGRRKRLLVADMDSTIIGQECIDELADAAGVRAEVASITGRAMRGEIGFREALRERVAMLAGVDAKVIDRILEERITLNPGAVELVATMRANGAYTVLVSGGFTEFVERIAERAGFDSFEANRLELDRGRLTGGLVPPILDQRAKAEELRRLASRRNLELGETLAVGDGANDVEMIGTAGLGVAFRAKPVLDAAAHVAIRHADLSGLLYLQGYERADFRCASSAPPL